MSDARAGVNRPALWFSAGLRFACRRCGVCCTGAPGYVFLRPGEVESLAAFLGLKGRDFRKRCTRRVARRTSLREESDGRCVFYREEGCGIYPVRPAQCRTYPFWLWNVAGRVFWERVSRECPGIGSGRLYSAVEIAALIGTRMP